MKFAKIVFLFLLLSIGVKAQELGIGPVKVWTNNYELENPFGISVYAFQPIWKLGIKVEYSTAFNNRDYYGYILAGYLKNTPVAEFVNSKSRYQSWEFSIITPSFNVYKDINIRASLGFSYDSFTLERNGNITAKTIDLGKDKKHGRFYSIGAEYINPFKLPVKLEILFKQKALNSTLFIEDIEQPFEKLKSMQILQFNLSYLF